MSPSPQNRKKNELPELLAPAGSPEALRVAVAAGADAVYLSGKRFGARKFARNFTDTEIEEAVTHAHRSDVRVYVTLNTLVHDRELEDVAEYLIWLYTTGVDAVLVQDTGVAALAREIVPLLPLHASTQMTIHSGDGVIWAAEQGFSRVVLARELPLEEITRIADETREYDIGLEVFAHGALCYCYSGQCLLSSVIGGRSGNRGSCAQPCRKPYTMVTADRDRYGRPTAIQEIPSPEQFLLSPKDLCTCQHLPALVTSPVVSLKIEGRMKSAEYVAVIVSTYRKALDAIAAGKAWSPEESLEDLSLAFNRGLTPGYLFGKRGADLMGRDAPDNRGICIGTVSSYDERTKAVRVRLIHQKIPSPGDGLLFTHPHNPRQKSGFLLNTVPVEKDGSIILKVPHAVEPGTWVRVTSSAGFWQRARRMIVRSASGLRHPVPLDLAVVIDDAGQMKIKGRVHSRVCGEIQVMYQPVDNLVPARSHPLTGEQIGLHLKKSGNTPFTINSLTLDYKGGLFMPVSRLNLIRREFLRLAEERMVASSRPLQEQVERSRSRWNLKKPPLIPAPAGKKGVSPLVVVGVYADSAEGVQGAVSAGCATVYFEPLFTPTDSTCRHVPGTPPPESQVLIPLAVCRDAGVRFILKFPRIGRNDQPGRLVTVLEKEGVGNIAGYMVENYGTARALLRMYKDPSLFGSVGLNIFNHEAVCHLPPFFSSLTLSPELSREEMELLIRSSRSIGCLSSFACIVQGNSEAMVSEDNIFLHLLSVSGKKADPDNLRFYGIRDTTGHVFPVSVDGECRTHIYNSSELCLINHLPSLLRMGINEIIIDARGRTTAYAHDMTRLYTNALALASSGIRDDDRRFEPLKDAVKLRARGGITAGHFLHGLRE